MSLLYYDDVVKEGYVQFKKSVHIGIWKRYWLCLRKASSLGTTRLEVIKNKKGKFNEEVDSLYCIIEVENIQLIESTPRDKKFSMTITCSGSKLSFCFDNYKEMEDWRTIINEYSCRSKEQRRDIFHVYVLNNPALPFYGECNLSVSGQSIVLTEADNCYSALISWPLVCLRCFSKDETKFVFEAGRSCKTGEGLFIFNTREGASICEMIKRASSEVAREQKNSLDRPPLPPPRPSSRRLFY